MQQLLPALGLPEAQETLCLQVRALLLEQCQDGMITTRSISLVLEHDAMHLETLCYMLAQVSCTPCQASRLMPHRKHLLRALLLNCASARQWSSQSDRGGPPQCGLMPICSGSMGTGMQDSSETLREVIAETTAGCLQEQRLRFEGGTAGTQASDGQHQNGNGAANGHSNGNGVANGHSNGCSAHVRRAASNGRSNGHSLANGAAMASGAPNAAAELVAVPGGSVTLGIDVAPESHFVWDNEGPRQPPQQVAGFQVSGRPVSNGEFHRFVVGARGYQQPELWAPADLQLLKRDGRSCPATWTVHVRQFHQSAVARMSNLTPAGRAWPWPVLLVLGLGGTLLLLPYGWHWHDLLRCCWCLAWASAMLRLPCWAGAG